MFLKIALGFGLGSAVSFFNHYIVIRLVNRITNQNIQGLQGKVASRYLIRYATNILTLYLVYQNPPMLIATAFGLMSAKNYVFIKYLLKKEGRK